MAFRQKTHTHSQSANIAIGRGQLTGGNPYAGVPPRDQLTNPVTTVLGDEPTPKKSALSNAIGAKTLEQEQRDEEIGNATLHYGW